MTATSATLDTVTIPPAPRRAPFYGRLWRTTAPELGFLVLAYPVAIVGFVVSITLISVGFGTLITFFLGVFLLIATLYASRGFGTAELYRLRWAGRTPIARPEWQDGRARQLFWNWLRSVFGNWHYWLYLLHTLVINPVVSLASWIVTIVWVSVGLGALSYGFWINVVSAGSHEAGKYYITNWLFPDALHGAGRTAAEIALNVVFGVVIFALLPFVTRGLVMMHWGIARLLLGPFRSDALQGEIIALNASRRAAVSAEGQSLRKLERDLHDGPQQRLVRLQMDIAAAQRQLDADPTAAHELLDGAMSQSKEALEELRALSRGFAPPLLLDRGLVPALESLATRSPVPVRFSSEVAPGVDLPLEVERNAYFVASELLANVAKHARATQVELRLASRGGEPTGIGWLDLTVTDDGSGGAVETVGHGLAGLDERLRGLGGGFEVSSPVGGPTVATAHLPLA